MASIGMPRDAAVVLSLILECILYDEYCNRFPCLMPGLDHSSGFSIFMFLGTICALTYNRRSDRPSLVVAVLLLILSTVHVAVNIIHAEDGLMKYRDTFLGGPVAFFEDFSQITYLIKDTLYVMQTLVADGVVIYRCYIVWQSTRVIILPCMLCSSIFVVELAQWHIFASAISRA
ncbi:uncharacterized protein BJ212DRAFT_595953 [Suillus subaureus]|uniref:Uncharacterized protein n=1 Tax=Suillus subaureus TaxID=48587 RepID=A0A9P7E2K1_9AGAM|nr:uncharacterized protein BJ212DRAFT_595953 [Suillus subaureus]KAG1809650.1 hypothetical protein BJ212DRAFT_595953 [Suillus subaureus]